MASKFLTLFVAFALLAGVALSLPVNNNEESAVVTEPAKESSEVPEGTVFNYEAPTEEELNPDNLDEEERQLTELLPPAIDSYVPFRVPEEPAEKPRKGGKKYNKEEKWINKNPAADAEPKEESSDEDNEERQYALLDFIIENLFQGIADQYNQQRRGGQVLAAEDGPVLVLNKGEYIPSPQRRIDNGEEDEQVVFQIHGQKGGYKFGFDTEKSASSA